MRSLRRSLPALLAAAALAGCDMNEFYVTQSAGGSGTGGEVFSFTDLTNDLLSGTAGPGAPDLTRVSGSVRTDSIVVTLTFASEVSPWSGGQQNGLDGFVDLDLDENTNSGIPSAIDEYGGNASLGVDFYVSLRDGNNGSRVQIVDAETGEATPIPASFSSRSVRFAIPRALVGDTDGTFRLAAVVGHRNAEATDFAPNAGFYLVAPR